MAKINIIDAADTVEAEATLEKAINVMRLDRENKQFEIPVLRELKQSADTVVTKVFEEMITEISEYLGN